MMFKRSLSTLVTDKKFYDIIIVGGGMIGSVLARVVANNPIMSDISILLLESGRKKDWVMSPIYSNRVSALNVGTKRLLQSADLWKNICLARCKPVTHMKVWGNGSNHLVTTFSSKEHSEVGEDLAYILENDLLIDVAYKSLNDFQDRVQVLYEVAVENYKFPKSAHNDFVQIKLRDGTSFECSLLVGADGVNSNVRKAMNTQYLSWNYNQRAIVATLQLSEVPQNDTAWQKFLSTGPVAILPLTDNLSSLVWSTTSKHSENLLSLSDESFVDALNTALWELPTKNTIVDNISNIMNRTFKRCGEENYEEIIPPTIKTVVPGSKASFPLGFGHASQYVAPRVALVGDAAHRVHPLAGQGVNLGFGDVKCLTEMLAKHMSCGGDIGDMLPLTEYETLRQRSNIPKMAAIDIIQRVAGHTWTPIMLLTNAGFQFTNGLPIVKKFLVDQAAAL